MYINNNLRRFLVYSLTFLITVSYTTFSAKVIKANAEDFSQSLYARGAVLMDGDSGRVLYGKDCDKEMPMASTTKIMTCIIALEYSTNLREVVEVSPNAAIQPDVQLNINTGEEYYLEDLLYSLMLKSHNDSAVAIAEHIGGTTEKFSLLMNRKARELGCTHTYFITPNGLDAEDDTGIHSTTARELALIMRYAIGIEDFLKIVQTRDYAFTNVEGTRQFALHNTNALLENMEGMLAGKTGFTADAGYCYVCAVKRGDRVFIVALLACGWPGNKTYKWKDTTKLIDYADQKYHYRDVWQDFIPEAIPVEKGVPLNGHLFQQAYVNGEIEQSVKELKILLRDDEKVDRIVDLKKTLKAPVKQGEIVGTITYRLDDWEVQSHNIVAGQSVRKVSLKWYWKKIITGFFKGDS